MPEEKPAKMNYTGNSHKQREDDGRKKQEKVISGEVVQRKKPLGKKVAETFTGDDMSSVGTYILFDVMIPAAKTMAADAVSQGIERLLFGDSARRSSRPGRSAYTSYNKMYSPNDDRTPGPRRDVSYKARATHDFDEVIIETRGEAENVIERLCDLVNEYDVATVADLYDLIGMSGSFTDAKWGWTDMRGASVVRTHHGYLLNLPKTVPLD